MDDPNDESEVGIDGALIYVALIGVIALLVVLAIGPVFAGIVARVK